MTQEEKSLLLQDLCARLPYWVKVKVRYYYEYEDGTFKKYNEIKYFDAEILDLLISGDRSLDDIKPYLRPMSSMTKEEEQEYRSLCAMQFDELTDANTTIYYFDTIESFDWLNAHHFDYRRLIPRGRAIEVTEENNPYKD